MPLSKIDKEYSLPLITPMDAKTVEIDRVFTNLLPILKHEGSRLARARNEIITIQMIVDAITRHSTTHFRGFQENSEIVSRWVESDFLSLVKRGDPEKQKIAAPLPMHLNTYKLRNPAFCRDYGMSMQLFSLLYYGAPETMRELRDYLWQGADYETDLYDGRTDLDIETLLMMRVLDLQRPDYVDSQKKTPIPMPLCQGQARLLGDDIERLLAYRQVVPRLVLLNYIENIMALHVGIYFLRLFQLVPLIVNYGQHDSTCEGCQIFSHGHLRSNRCLHSVEIIVDMGEKFLSPMADLARRQFEKHMEQMNVYVRAHLMLKKLYEFGESLVKEERLTEEDLQSLEQIVTLRAYPDQVELKFFFKDRIRRLMENEDGERDDRLAAIQKLGFDEVETYVEMLHMLRQSYHQGYYLKLFDSVFQKNHENGLLRQGVGQKRNKRRYAMGSGLLETLVQIAVLKRAPNGEFRTRHIRIDEFLDWLETRYGVYISRLPEGMTPSITELEALRLNVQAFKQRLREIGFYTDLSDAYVAQVIRPRYTLEKETA